MGKEKNRNSYGNIFKAIALFGGVKIFQILISVCRAKLIAILIGPTGMGISNLFLSTTNTIGHVTGCGLQTSAVRDVAKSHELGDQQSINITITVLRGVVWLTGLLGAIVVFIGARLLSNFAFGNDEYTVGFRILSLMMVFSQINVGQVALMQGTFHYKDMAKATLGGHLLSLILTIPIYYFHREDGIVPALLIASLITLFFSWIYSRKQKYERVELSFRQFFHHGRGMISLGIVLAIGGLISNLSSYLLNIFISNYGSLHDVGLYGAGITISTSYVFLVLTAMSTDYVPRIAALSGNEEEQVNTINKQAVMVMLLITPLIVFFMVFAKEAIQILYTSEFFPIIPMLIFIMVATFIQAISWCLSYAIIARGDSKVFLYLSIFSCIVFVSLKVGLYALKGLVGIGVAQVIGYIIYTITLFLICRRLFAFSFNRDFWATLRVFGSISLISFISSVLFQEGVTHYILGLLLIGTSCYYSFRGLDKRIHLKEQIISRIKKR